MIRSTTFFKNFMLTSTPSEGLSKLWFWMNFYWKKFRSKSEVLQFKNFGSEVIERLQLFERKIMIICFIVILIMQLTAFISRGEILLCFSLGSNPCVLRKALFSTHSKNPNPHLNNAAYPWKMVAHRNWQYVWRWTPIGKNYRSRLGPDVGKSWNEPWLSIGRVLVQALDDNNGTVYGK